MAAASRRRGFTLIEILVVVALVAVMTATVILSIPSRSTAELQRLETQRLHARMAMAREEAVLRARTFGLRVESDGYRFLRHTRSGWDGFDDGHPLRVHRLPDRIRLELDVDGTETALESANGTEKGPVPQIYFLAGGEILPGYSLRVLGEDSKTEFTIAAGEEKWLEISESRY